MPLRDENQLGRSVYRGVIRVLLRECNEVDFRISKSYSDLFVIMRDFSSANVLDNSGRGGPFLDVCDECSGIGFGCVEILLCLRTLDGQ